MSDIFEISLRDEINFLKYIVIPSFAPILNLPEERRYVWMSETAIKVAKFKPEKVELMMLSLGTYQSKVEAETELGNKKQEERQRQLESAGEQLVCVNLIFEFITLVCEYVLCSIISLNFFLIFCCVRFSFCFFCF